MTGNAGAGGFTVVITGGASGIGLAAAERIIAAGGTVALLDINGEAASATASKLGAGATAVRCDVTSEESIRAGFAAAIKGRPPVTGLVASAGATPTRREVELPDGVAHWARVIDTHLNGTFLSARVVGPAIAANGGGSIVTVSSVLAERPGAVMAYGAAKAGIANLTRSLAVHWGRQNVRVNAVAPGWTDTPFIRPGGVERDMRPVLDAVPARRLLLAEEIAEVIWFLLSPASSAINGSYIPCDGGYMAATGWPPYGGLPED